MPVEAPLFAVLVVQHRQLDELPVEHGGRLVDVGQSPIGSVQAVVLVGILLVLQVALQGVCGVEPAALGLLGKPVQAGQPRLEVAGLGQELGQHRRDDNVVYVGTPHPFLEASQSARRLVRGERQQGPRELQVEPDVDGLDQDGDLGGVQYVRGDEHRRVLLVDVGFSHRLFGA